MKTSYILVLFIMISTISCTHDPFPAPPGVMNPGDTTDPIDPPVDTTKPCHPDTVYYARDIQPILTANCAFSGCHDPSTATDGVILNNYSNVFNTADIRPFDTDGSDLYEMITEPDNNDRMPPPPYPRLSQSNIDLIAKWINQGALNLECDECDTTNLSYTANIKAIFDQNCGNCHAGNNASTNRRLTTYTEVKDAILNTNLLQRINGHPGVPVMPQGGKMPQCNIDKIEAWFNTGMPQ